MVNCVSCVSSAAELLICILHAIENNLIKRVVRMVLSQGRFKKIKKIYDKVNGIFHQEVCGC